MLQLLRDEIAQAMEDKTKALAIERECLMLGATSDLEVISRDGGLPNDTTLLLGRNSLPSTVGGDAPRPAPAPAATLPHRPALTPTPTPTSALIFTLTLTLTSWRCCPTCAMPARAQARWRSARPRARAPRVGTVPSPAAPPVSTPVAALPTTN